MTFAISEIVVLGAVFAGLVWFIWTHIASDLPDDFLRKSREFAKRDTVKGEGDGGIRDHW